MKDPSGLRLAPPLPMKRSVLHRFGRSSLVRLFERFRVPGATIFSMHRFSVPDLGVRGHDLALLRTNLAALRARKDRIVELGDLIAPSTRWPSAQPPHVLVYRR